MPASPGSSFPPRALRAMISLRSSAEETSSNSARGSTPTSRRIAFEAVLSAQISGLRATLNHCSGRATRSTVVSAWTIA